MLTIASKTTALPSCCIHPPADEGIRCFWHRVRLHLRLGIFELSTEGFTHITVPFLCHLSSSDQLQMLDFLDRARSNFRAGWLPASH